MRSCKVAVVGAGLAGISVASALHASDVDVVVIEARKRIGGRILTVDENGLPTDDGFDLGPSWYWPRMQPAMEVLVEELGLKSFYQHSDGDVVFERMSREKPQRYMPAQQDQQSMRLEGGTAAVVRALAAGIPSDRIVLGTKVSAMALLGDGIRLSLENGDGADLLQAEYAVAALPPRLLAETVKFTPEQDAGITARWRDTPTWMAPHAKFFAIYERPFWRSAGLAGTAQSMVGPMVEIHDATTSSGKAALFGFLGVDAGQRAALGEKAIKQACLGQLGRLFGREALNPRTTILKDWASDLLTSTEADLSDGRHPEPRDGRWVEGQWKERLLLAGSETSPSEPGYLAGAVVAAKRTVADILSKADFQ